MSFSFVTPNDDEPFTGIVFDFYENGEKELDGNYRKGLMNGEWTYYHENGQIMSKGNYKNGDGSYPDSFTDEYKKEYPPYGGRNGKWTYWFWNGQKINEGTYKDSKWDGKWTQWYENGQKSSEKTYKDGKMISKECWDEDGNEIQCP